MKMTISLPENASRTSDVFIGDGVLREFPKVFGDYVKGKDIFWIWDENVWELWGKRLGELGLSDINQERLILFPASESNKRLSYLEVLARQLVNAGADRGSALIAVGGGVTGDVAGFLASIYMRGIPCFQIPTSLLAQVDSSIGGKTGVDLPEGKNLLGTFSQPRAIWMDARLLETLPREQFRQGMAEVIKTAMIGDEVLWKYLESHTEAIRRKEKEALVRVVSACCILKAKVVESDEREAGYRRVLNLGHTVGHALEKLSDYGIQHGDAVAMGMVAASSLAVRLGELSREDLLRLEKLCTAWGLPIRLPKTISPDAILASFRADKKRIADQLHFILPVRIGEVADRDDINLEELKEVLIALQKEAP
jgi:3-dehydroquinate synthase